MPQPIRITIDGQALTAEAGQTILAIASRHGISIPTLCHLNGLSAVGACRICLVEVKGVPRLLPACATEAADGMTVTTDSPRLQQHRRVILQLIFAERNHLCAVCVSNGNCELQALAQDHGITHTRFAYRFKPFPVDASHPRFVYDANRCILCTRCVRTCREIEGARTWDVIGRGIRSDLAADLDVPWGQSETCTSCGKCVQSCPTGALFEKGRAVGEMKKNCAVISNLATARLRGR